MLNAPHIFQLRCECVSLGYVTAMVFPLANLNLPKRWGFSRIATLYLDGKSESTLDHRKRGSIYVLIDTSLKKFKVALEEWRIEINYI